MKGVNLILVIFLFVGSIFAQNGASFVNSSGDTIMQVRDDGRVIIGAAVANGNAVLDVDAINNDKGILVPRLSTAQRTAIGSLGTSDEGLLVYDETSSSFWYWNGSQWNELAIAGGGSWGLTGNAGTVDGTNFIGTTDNVPLDFKVNSQRVMRYQSATDSPNLIGGYSGNSIASGVTGATIAGGGSSGYENSITANYSFIGGGTHNQASGSYSTVGAGLGNSTQGVYSTVGGGKVNSASGDNSTVAGGVTNTASGGASAVGGGVSNTASGGFSAVGGGSGNSVSGDASTIPGGSQNSVSGSYSFAAGFRALAGHDGTFVWADNTNADFTSRAAKQFLIRASNGVGINKNNPTTALDVNGTVTATAFVGDGSGLTNLPSGSDNLGNHTATQNLILNGNYLSGDGGNEGVFVDASGNVGIGSTGSGAKLDVSGTVKIENNFSEPALQITNNLSTSGVASALALTNDDNKTLEIGVNSSGHNQPNEAYLKVKQGSALTFDFTGGEKMRIQSNGNVGIGTNNPTQAKVVINGSVLNTLSYGWLNSSGNTGGAGSPSTNPYSLYANERIAASEFNAHSDERIKNIRGISNAGEDLATLMQIEITDYTMIDTLGKGKQSYKKVIAQQVEKVYPQAVTTNLTEVVPDIYKRANVKDGWIMLATDLKPGERVKIITDKSAEVYEITQVEKNRFQVDELKTQNLKLETLFVYGREVDDFHTVDYEAISMLNVSATQELYRVIQQQQKQIDALKSQNKAFEERFAQIEQALQERDTKNSVKLTSAVIK